MKPRPELLALAERCGAVLTGKPDGSEAITVVFSIQSWRDFDAALTAPAPIDMVLFCPACGGQHIDAPMTDAEYTGRLHESSWWELGGDKPERWTNPPHRSHLCHFCKHVWRPADTTTNGVKAVQTKGKNDSPDPPFVLDRA